VLRKAGIVVPVFFHHLFLTRLEGAQHLTIVVEYPLDRKKILPRLYVLGVGGEEGAFRERQIIDGIKQVGFAASVLPQEAMNLPLERDRSLFVVPEIG